MSHEGIAVAVFSLFLHYVYIFLKNEFLVVN